LLIEHLIKNFTLMMLILNMSSRCFLNSFNFFDKLWSQTF